MNPYNKVPTGCRMFRNTGELSFETSPRTAGTFPCTFLSPVSTDHCKVINERGMLQVVHNSLLSCFNI
jgi:hypothetical protein